MNPFGPRALFVSSPNTERQNLCAQWGGNEIASPWGDQPGSAVTAALKCE